MTQPSSPTPPPAAAETQTTRKKSGPAKGWKNAKAAAAAEADGRVAVISIKLTRLQLGAVERWRSQFDDLAQGAALRVLLELGLALTPDAAVDPLAIAKATHRRKAKAAK